MAVTDEAIEKINAMIASGELRLGDRLRARREQVYGRASADKGGPARSIAP